MGDALAHPAQAHPFGLHRRLIQQTTITAFPLGRIQRQLGVAHQTFRICTIARKHRPTHAGRQLHGPARHVKWCAQRLQDDATDRIELLFAIQSKDHQRKLITTKTCQHIVGPQHAKDACGGFCQHTIAAVAAQGVIDVLEAVQIQHSDCQHGLLCQRSSVRHFQHLEQPAAIWQATCFVEESKLLDTLLALLLRADVAQLPQRPLRYPVDHNGREITQKDPPVTCAYFVTRNRRTRGEDFLHALPFPLRLCIGRYQPRTERCR